MPRSRSKRKGAAHARLPIQSSLLKLPPEIRNRIYELVCRNDLEIEVAVEAGDIALIPHPLARSFRQLREEFGPVFEAQAFENASTVTCHTTNLDVGGNRLRYWLADRVSDPQILQRKCRIKSNLDDSFDECLTRNADDVFAVRPIIFGPWDGLLVLHLELQACIDFHKREVDVGRLRRWMWEETCPVCNPTLNTDKLHSLLRNGFARFLDREAEARREKTVERRRKRLKKKRTRKARSKR